MLNNICSLFIDVYKIAYFNVQKIKCDFGQWSPKNYFHRLIMSQTLYSLAKNALIIYVKCFSFEDQKPVRKFSIFAIHSNQHTMHNYVWESVNLEFFELTLKAVYISQFFVLKLSNLPHYCLPTNTVNANFKPIQKFMYF